METGFLPVPDWFSFENQGAGVAVTSLGNDGRQDLIVLMVDNPPGRNRGMYRIGRKPTAISTAAGRPGSTFPTGSPRKTKGRALQLPTWITTAAWNSWS
jgi:hypothetical protein